MDHGPQAPVVRAGSGDLRGEVRVCAQSSGPGRASKKKVETAMAVRIQHQPVRRNGPEDILFLALTLAPWAVLAWLLLVSRH
jgi:hypothetical protein